MPAANLFSLVVHMLTAFIQLYGGNTLEIFGVRLKSDTTEITADTTVYFTVFGTNLPRSGYFLSSTDRCEDSDQPHILVKTSVPLATRGVFKNAVRLVAIDGVPFSMKFPTFQLCHKSALSVNKVLLQVRDKAQDDFFLSPWMIVLICIIALIISAYCSGANFAYMRMSINDMALLAEAGEEPHKTHARKIIKYRKQSNWLICTMAVANILANTVFTNGVTFLVENHRYGAVLKYVVPTVVIVLIGEMLPQSVCNRFGLVLAAKTRHATLILFIVCAPLAWPLSKLIDYFLGREVREIYSEEKLKTLIKVQAKKMEETAQDILARIADFPKKTVEDMMTPMEDTFVISSSDRLDVKLLVTILEKGYTRIPVFEEKNRLNLTSVLNVKDLATMTIDHRSTVQQFMSMIDDSRKQMRFVLASQRGEALMQEMMKGDQHLCAVMKFSYGRYRVVGLITFEDVIEEVFGDIEDDSDKMWNNRRAGVHKDQQTLDWFRTSEAEQFTGLGVNATLRLIQSIFDCCPLLVTLGYDVLRMKGLLSADKLRHAEEDEIIIPRSDKKVLIFFRGTITVENEKTTTYRLEANRADFRPYISGRSLVKRIFKERLQALSCLKNTLGNKTTPKLCKIRVITKTAYFEVTSSNFLSALRDPDVGYEYNMLLATPPSVTPEDVDEAVGATHPHDQLEIESTQYSSPNARKRLNTTPKRSDVPLPTSLTPRRLRASLLKLKASAEDSKELLSPDTTASERKLKSTQLALQPSKTAREPRISAGPPSKARHQSSAFKEVVAAHSKSGGSAEKDRKSVVKSVARAPLQDSKGVEKGSKQKIPSKEQTDLVVVPSATNLHVSETKVSTPKKRSLLMSLFKRRNQ